MLIKKLYKSYTNKYLITFAIYHDMHDPNKNSYTRFDNIKVEDFLNDYNFCAKYLNELDKDNFIMDFRERMWN